MGANCGTADATSRFPYFRRGEDMENGFHTPQTLVDLWRAQIQIAYDQYQLAKEAIHQAVYGELPNWPEGGGFLTC